METSVAAFIDNFNISRKKATVLVGLIIALVSVPATLSFGPLADFKILDRTIFDFLDYSTSNILLPFNTMLICLIAGWFIKSFSKETFGESFLAKIFNILLKFVIPIILLLVLICGL